MKQSLTRSIVALACAMTGVARADDAAQKPFLGLGIATPDTGSLPGRFRPSYGVAPVSAGDYRFDFHGFMVVPLRMGMNHRAHASSEQYSTVYHAPPVTPDDLDRFEH